MIVISVLYFMVVMIIASYFTPDGYQLLSHTISEMAGQNLSHAWIMRLGFIGFGMLMSTGLIQGIRKKMIPFWVGLPFIAYALSILLTGFFSTYSPLSPLDFNETESQIHSIFATSAGFLLITALLIDTTLHPSRTHQKINGLFMLGITLFSALFGLFPSVQGLLQRIMYAISFLWMVYFYSEYYHKKIK